MSSEDIDIRAAFLEVARPWHYLPWAPRWFRRLYWWFRPSTRPFIDPEIIECAIKNPTFLEDILK